MEYKMKAMFVPSDIAKDLELLGFKDDCFAYYSIIDDNEPCLNPVKINYSSLEGFESCLAPLWQQVTEWLRDNHNIHIVIEVALNSMFSVTITPVDFLKVGTVTKLNKVFTPYESALESGIKAALTYLKQKK